MGKFNDHITEDYKSFIERQRIFFVATAPIDNDGHINLSPKGFDSFKVLSPNRVAYVDVIGSGNETSAHVLENERLTFMFCAFEGKPNILRLYGKGYTVLPGEREWNELALHFTIYPNTRQIIVADIHKTQTSCGFGVPFYEYKGERDIMLEWAEKKGPEGLEQYKKEKNWRSIDGLITPLAKQRQSSLKEE